MVDKDSELRRLRSMSIMLWILILGVVATLAANRPVITIIVLGVHAGVFAEMLRNVRRDIDALIIKLPDEKSRSHRSRRSA